MLLEMRDVFVQYGKATALRGISLGVTEGEIVALIGSNGAGKTTTLRAISVSQYPDVGRDQISGENHKRNTASRHRADGNSSCTRGKKGFWAHDCRGEFRTGSLPPQRSTGNRSRSRTDIPEFSRPEEPQPTAGRIAKRRRTANAGDGQGSHGVAQSASSR